MVDVYGWFHDRESISFTVFLLNYSLLRGCEGVKENWRNSLYIERNGIICLLSQVDEQCLSFLSSVQVNPFPSLRRPFKLGKAML